MDHFFEKNSELKLDYLPSEDDVTDFTVRSALMSLVNKVVDKVYADNKILEK